MIDEIKSTQEASELTGLTVRRIQQACKKYGKQYPEWFIFKGGIWWITEEGIAHIESRKITPSP